MPQRNARSRQEPSPKKPHGGSRSLLGEDSWFEIAYKAVTVSALAFGVWAYFHSVQPIFEREQELQAERKRASQLNNQVTYLRNDISTLNERLERFQAAAAKHRRGIVLSYLSDIKRELQRDAFEYQRLAAPQAFDLRDYSLAYAGTKLKMLGSVQPESPESYQKEALEFFRLFVSKEIPSMATDLRLFDNLLDAYDRQEQASGTSP